MEPLAAVLAPNPTAAPLKRVPEVGEGRVVDIIAPGAAKAAAARRNLDHDDMLVLVLVGAPPTRDFKTDEEGLILQHLLWISVEAVSIKREEMFILAWGKEGRWGYGARLCAEKERKAPFYVLIMPF